MLTRRGFCGGLLGALSASTAVLANGTECAVFTPQRQHELSPGAALDLLRAGNERFVGGHTINCNLLQQVHETATHQAPFAAIVGCIDSRVPPEFVFDQRIGDVFCARVAGNFANVDILGSLEYATEVAGAKAIIVLGHNGCGAIRSAVDGVKLGNITAMLDNLAPALASIDAADGERSSKNAGLVQKVAEANARLTAASLTQRSPILQNLVDSGNLSIVAAMHDITTGRVAWL
ncbi:carbonic anhydrase [Devosia sp. A369]